jgi:hypothetical protein
MDSPKRSGLRIQMSGVRILKAHYLIFL